jgi:cysteine desulfuration protein SufE
MKTLCEKQEAFIADLEMLDTWQDKFTYIIDYHTDEQVIKPKCLRETDKLPNCRSNTYFHAELVAHPECGKIIICAGWSNSAVLSGLIAIICEMFNGVPLLQLNESDIYFHIKSGLIEQLTPLRRDALEEIICRIKRLH